LNPGVRAWRIISLLMTAGYYCVPGDSAVSFLMGRICLGVT
jgi:hypothetical protein